MVDPNNQAIPAEIGAQVDALIAQLAHHSQPTAMRALMIEQLALKIGTALDFSEHDLARLQVSAALHDIGKLDIPIGLLEWPTQYDTKQRAAVDEHAHYGLRRLTGVAGWLGPWGAVVDSHHVAWSDLQHADLPPNVTTGVGIVSVASAFVAMTSPRPHAATFSQADTLAILAAEDRFSSDLLALIADTARPQPTQAFVPGALSLSRWGKRLTPAARMATAAGVVVLATVGITQFGPGAGSNSNSDNLLAYNSHTIVTTLPAPSTGSLSSPGSAPTNPADEWAKSGTLSTPMDPVLPDGPSSGPTQPSTRHSGTTPRGTTTQSPPRTGSPTTPPSTSTQPGSATSPGTTVRPTTQPPVTSATSRPPATSPPATSPPPTRPPATQPPPTSPPTTQEWSYCDSSNDWCSNAP